MQFRIRDAFAIVGILFCASLVLAADGPLAELKDTTVACSPSTATKIKVNTRIDDMLISNKSTTCVRVGGSGVTASTGAKIGSGCHDGPNISVPAHVAYCFSESGTVTVDVVFGVH